jgi:DNA replication initiation complex subunit (GINS family)
VLLERQKATRLVKKIRKQIEASTDATEIEDLKSKLHTAEVDVVYTQYFPFMERYESLYPQAKADQDDDGTPAANRSLNEKRPEMWGFIEEAMKEGEDALERIRDRVIDKGRTTDSPPPTNKEKGEKKRDKSEKSSTKKQGSDGRSQRAAPKAKDEDDGDDFFEIAV